MKSSFVPESGGMIEGQEPEAEVGQCMMNQELFSRLTKEQIYQFIVNHSHHNVLFINTFKLEKKSNFICN